jgi:hypothetical protein
MSDDEDDSTQDPELTREDQIDAFILAGLDNLCSEAVYANFKTHPLTGSREPQWWELRDSICRVLFEMDREDVELERHAQHVRDNCL